MFLFSCCTSGEGQYSYELRQNYQKVSKGYSPAQLHDRVNNSNQYVIKVKRSNYEQLLKKSSKQKWTDPLFPPHKQSLGDISEVSFCNWKRLSDIVTKPVLFTSNTKSNQIIKSNLTDCYFLSALSSLIQEPKRIKQIFVTQDINNAGMYCVKIRTDGSVQEVIVDDYVPVNQIGSPIFTPPKDSEIWMPLLEKAWAKINGSYANIINGNPAQVFKAFNFAPSQVFFLEDKPDKKQKLWKLLIDAVHRKSPVSFQTSHNEQNDWIHLNLIPSHRYSLLYAAQICHTDKKTYRMLKIRNPNGKANWQGRGSAHDQQFWQKVVACEQKTKLFQSVNENQGEMLIVYTDFVKYFSEIHISYQLQHGNFIWEEIFFNGKNGSFWEIDVTHEGQYCFELHQESLRNKSLLEQQKYYCRSTLLLGKVTQPNNYEYVNGAMRFIEEDVLVNHSLKPGKYIIYAKIQGQLGEGGYHKKASLSCYSDKICKFRLVQKTNCQNFLQKMFLNYGREYKRQQYNRQKMWISWKLLFKECGFAYIAFGNAKDSEKKFTVKFQSKDFQSMHFKLKHPFKADKSKQNTLYQLVVNPGEEKIILARVINNRITALKFPPPIQMKIE